MKAYERLIRYAAFETGSAEHSKTHPSNPAETEFAAELEKEIRALGAETFLSSAGVLYGEIPGNRPSPPIGLIAHLDTVGDVEYKAVRPRVLKGYDGGDVVYPDGSVLSVDLCPALKSQKGKTLILSDGTTLLGADDKAGVAEIVTLLERLNSDPSLPHGKVCVAFTPDEEIGRGTDFFDIERFGAAFAYTLDGGAFGEVEYETFNASTAYLNFYGVNIHTGTAKGVMRNAARVACEFEAMLPRDERPESTEGYEGFYHLTEIRGDVEKACLRYMLRDHDGDKLFAKKENIARLAALLNEKYGEGTCKYAFEDIYSNMAPVILKHPFLIENAKKAVVLAGGVPVSRPIRGGTDGAMLSFRGLPTPNLGTGSGNHHSKHEYAIAEDMDAAVEMLVRLLALFTEPPAGTAEPAERKE